MTAPELKKRAHALLSSATACLDLRQHRRAEEELIRAIADIRALDRMEVEEREARKSA